MHPVGYFRKPTISATHTQHESRNPDVSGLCILLLINCASLFNSLHDSLCYCLYCGLLAGCFSTFVHLVIRHVYNTLNDIGN